MKFKEGQTISLFDTSYTIIKMPTDEDQYYTLNPSWVGIPDSRFSVKVVEENAKEIKKEN